MQMIPCFNTEEEEEEFDRRSRRRELRQARDKDLIVELQLSAARSVEGLRNGSPETITTHSWSEGLGGFVASCCGNLRHLEFRYVRIQMNSRLPHGPYYGTQYCLQIQQCIVASVNQEKLARYSKRSF